MPHPATRVQSLTPIALFASAVLLGGAIAYLGSRPHFDDTGIQAGLLVLSAAFLGFLGPDRPWLWALGVGVWTPIASWIVHNPPDPRSRPLPLPWGLTDSHAAQSIVTCAVILAFPLVGAYAGMLVRRIVSAGTTLSP